MKQMLTTLKAFFTPKEWMILSIATVLSALILSSTFWMTPVQQGVNPYQLLAYNIDVRDRQGDRLDPFYTIFFANYEAKAPQEEIVDWMHVLLDDMKMDKNSKISADGNSLVIKNVGSDLPKRERSSNDSKFK